MKKRSCSKKSWQCGERLSRPQLLQRREQSLCNQLVGISIRMRVWPRDPQLGGRLVGHGGEHIDECSAILLGGLPHQISDAAKVIIFDVVQLRKIDDHELAAA